MSNIYDHSDIGKTEYQYTRTAQLRSLKKYVFRLLNLPFFYAAGGGGEVHSDPVETAAV